MSKAERVNQLTPAIGYNVKKMIFSDPVSTPIPNMPSLFYKRINISTQNPDGTIGDLILPTTEIFSFGVQITTDPQSGKPNGHSMGLALWNKDGPTPDEKAWTDSFTKIAEHTKKHILANQEKLEMYDLVPAHLTKVNQLYWKKEKGKIVEGQGPALYPKLIEYKVSKKRGGKGGKNDEEAKTEEKSGPPESKILTMFFNAKDDSPLDPLTLIGKYCYVRAAIKLESIYFGGGKITMQIKLFEANVRLLDNPMKPLLTRPKTTGLLSSGGGTSLSSVKNDEDDEVVEDDAGSLNGDVAEEEQKPPTPPPPVARKIVKKVAKKNN